MIKTLHNIISEHMSRNSDINNWESIRNNYSVYTYITFLILSLKEIGMPLQDIKKEAYENGLEEYEVLEYLFALPEVDTLANEVFLLIEHKEVEDVNAIYQEFISIDYVVDNKNIVFNGGKNSRDVLGSYYTQEEFAEEIVKKCIDDLLQKQKDYQVLKIIDFSCGGGAFLAAANNYCEKRGISHILYGIDVDPIALMITRARLLQCCKENKTMIDIRLGNPLLNHNKNKNKNTLNAFKLALSGRFYSQEMGIDIEDKYDIVVGNPPWEKIRFEEKKFLQHYITNKDVGLKSVRTILLEKISLCNKEYYFSLLNDYESAKKNIKKNELFSNTNCGELNTYALFTELALRILSDTGISGLIVKSSLVKMPVYSGFFKKVMDNRCLYELYMFTNKKKIFNIDSREEFSVVLLSHNGENILKMAINLKEYTEFYNAEKIELPYEIINIINPNTGMIPNIKNNDELQFLIKMYETNKVFGEVYSNSKYGRLVHLTNHSEYIRKEKKDGYEPIYEGKFIELFTGKYATFAGLTEAEKYKNKATAKLIEDVEGLEYPESRYYIKKDIWKNISKKFEDDFIIAWRSLTSSTNRRTMLATILPLVPTCQSIQILQLGDEKSMLHVLTLFNSVVFDYIVRLKMAGLDLTQTIIKQIPVPDEANYNNVIVVNGIKDTIDKHINSRLYRLYKNDERINAIFEKVEYYDMANSIPRKQIIAEIDLLVSKLYGMEKSQFSKIVSTFDKFYTKEEMKKWF